MSNLINNIILSISYYFVSERYPMGSAPEALKRPPEKSCGCGSKMSDKGVRFLKNEIKNDLFISHFNIQDIYLR